MVRHRELGFNEVGYIGGLLPYSRMKTGAASGVAVEKTTALRLPRAEFREMISSQYQLVESFVHLMLDRTRDYTKLDQQNEKMISLGKLSAGLAHELNNPAAAVVRSASALKKHLGFVPEKFQECYFHPGYRSTGRSRERNPGRCAEAGVPPI